MGCRGRGLQNARNEILGEPADDAPRTLTISNAASIACATKAAAWDKKVSPAVFGRVAWLVDASGVRALALVWKARLLSPLALLPE